VNTNDADANLAALLQEIDLPERAYELAVNRYKDLAAWIARPESELASYDSHVFVQGSFALGTAIRPINEGEEYDLDFTCKLRRDVSRETHTQQQVKALLGQELDAYRTARRIQKPLEEKNRCWRLEYRDELPFHMDVVPGIRADENRRTVLRERMEVAGVNAAIAQEAARRALWITDIRDPQYRLLNPNWPSSNPGGYQLWFTSRLQEVRKSVFAEAQVDPVPIFRSKAPLQQVVQLLKRHRDLMFKESPDRKPVSVILTTVAGSAYQAGDSLSATMAKVLEAFERIRSSNTDEILNPVNPHENFADRWTRPDCVHLRLKANFHMWISEARRDFGAIMSIESAQRFVEVAKSALAVKVSDQAIRHMDTGAPASPHVYVPSSAPPRPWAR